MDLQVLWFVIIGVFFTGYFVLEGFDFGVGMLLPFMKGDEIENDRRRTAAIRTIGPIWDGNEVWLITGGAAIFAAFPEWYATLFSGFYLPLVLILMGLIVRGVSLEWRVKVDTLKWRRLCDAGTAFGSYLPTLLWGVGFTNIVMGVPLNEQGRLDSFYDGFLGLLNPLGLLGGVAFVLLFMLHGATFLGFKSHDPLRAEMHAFAKKFIAGPAIVVGAAYLLWIQLTLGAGWTWIPLVLAAVGLVVSVVAIVGNKDGLAFWMTAFAIICCAIVLFGSLFPDVMPSTSDLFAGWDIRNASSSPYTLKVMTWAAVCLTPIVLVGQIWTYWAFRKRVSV